MKAFLVLILTGCLVDLSFAEAADDAQGVTFAQLTDAHLFDEGWKQPLPDAYRLAADNWGALRWSIDQINQLVRSGRRIDFIVYTGDLGLQNVSFGKRDGCLAHPIQIEPGLPAVPEEQAESDLLAELDRLLVRRVLFVSGNNDPMDEDASDGRYDCFLSALQGRAAGLAQPLAIESLAPDHPIRVNGVMLLGLNSSSFKKTTNYEQVCQVTTAEKTLRKMLDESCPDVEMDGLRKQVRERAPTLIFTHVPDLKDPHRLEAAWDLSGEVRQLWEQEATQANVLGIFSGHFHDWHRSIYGSTAGVKGLAISESVAGKTYVAPPLAIKNQVDTPDSARGFLVADVTLHYVSGVQVYWFASQSAFLSAALH